MEQGSGNGMTRLFSSATGHVRRYFGFYLTKCKVGKGRSDGGVIDVKLH